VSILFCPTKFSSEKISDVESVELLYSLQQEVEQRTAEEQEGVLGETCVVGSTVTQVSLTTSEDCNIINR